MLTLPYMYGALWELLHPTCQRHTMSVRAWAGAWDLHLPSATMCYWPPVGSMFSPSRWKIADMLRGNCKLSLSLGCMNQANLSSTHIFVRTPPLAILKHRQIRKGSPFFYILNTNVLKFFFVPSLCSLWKVLEVLTHCFTAIFRE